MKRGSFLKKVFWSRVDPVGNAARKRVSGKNRFTNPQRIFPRIEFFSENNTREGRQRLLLNKLYFIINNLQIGTL
jgi:hypothetical protein